LAETAADGLINICGFERLARTVHLVVLDVDHIRVTELDGILLRRFGKQQQAGVVKGGLVVEKDNQIPRLIQVETDLVSVNFSVGRRRPAA